MRFFKISSRSKRRVHQYQSEARRWLTMPYHVTVIFFSSMGSILAAWWSKRNLRYLFQGLPSLILFVGLVVLTSFCIFQDRNVLARDYQMQAAKAYAEAQSLRVANRDATKPLALVQTYYNRLTYLKPDDAENRYQLARSYEERAALISVKARPLIEKLKNTKDEKEKESLQKEIDEKAEEYQAMQAATLRLMSKLAPSETRGYGRAHLWMFKYLYRMEQTPDGRAVPPAPTAILDAERHLLHALEWPGPDSDVKLGANFG